MTGEPDIGILLRQNRVVLARRWRVKRRKIVYLNVTRNPNAHWVALQLGHTWGV